MSPLQQAQAIGRLVTVGERIAVALERIAEHLAPAKVELGKGEARKTVTFTIAECLNSIADSEASR